VSNSEQVPRNTYQGLGSRRQAIIQYSLRSARIVNTPGYVSHQSQGLAEGRSSAHELFSFTRAQISPCDTGVQVCVLRGRFTHTLRRSVIGSQAPGGLAPSNLHPWDPWLALPREKPTRTILDR